MTAATAAAANPTGYIGINAACDSTTKLAPLPPNLENLLTQVENGKKSIERVLKLYSEQQSSFQSQLREKEGQIIAYKEGQASLQSQLCEKAAKVNTQTDALAALQSQLSNKESEVKTLTRKVQNLTIALFSVLSAAVVTGIAIVAGDCLKRQAPDNYL